MIFADPPYGIAIVRGDGYLGGGVRYHIPFGGVRKKGSAEPKAPAPESVQDGGDTSATNVGGGTVGRGCVSPEGIYAPVIGDETTETAEQSTALLLGLYPKAAHIWWGGNHYANCLPPSPCWIVWDKEQVANFADAELAWTNQKTAVRICRHQWSGLMKASEHGVRRVHPTQKPVALAEWCFEKYGSDNDIVLDPFLGSGMSLVACERMGRRGRGLELSPDYIAVCLERLQDEGLTPTLLQEFTIPDDIQEEKGPGTPNQD